MDTCGKLSGCFSGGGGHVNIGQGDSKAVTVTEFLSPNTASSHRASTCGHKVPYSEGPASDVTFPFVSHSNTSWPLAPSKWPPVLPLENGFSFEVQLPGLMNKPLRHLLSSFKQCQ